MAEIDEVNRAVVVIKHKAGSIKVDGLVAAAKAEQPFLFGNVPAKPHDDAGERAARFFFQRDFLAFLQIDCHKYSFDFRINYRCGKRGDCSSFALALPI